ncbi:hypothetical protein BH09VER1_BH09VER1_24440 [soil metagenome]
MNGKNTYKGFSLIELLSVMAIIVIMSALMLPAISGFSSTMGRRGAVNVLLNGFEQARVAALESGSKVYVVMRRNQALGEQDAFCVMRARSDSLNDPASPPYVRLTRWQKLPTSILFYEAVGSLTATGKTLPSDLVASLAGNPPASELFAVAFSRTGQIFYPSTGDVNLFLAEGSRVGANTTAHGPSQSITERLSFRRYTGRAQLDFTAPPQS